MVNSRRPHHRKRTTKSAHVFFFCDLNSNLLNSRKCVHSIAPALRGPSSLSLWSSHCGVVHIIMRGGEERELADCGHDHRPSVQLQLRCTSQRRVQPLSPVSALAVARLSAKWCIGSGSGTTCGYTLVDRRHARSSLAPNSRQSIDRGRGPKPSCALRCRSARAGEIHTVAVGWCVRTCVQVRRERALSPARRQPLERGAPAATTYTPKTSPTRSGTSNHSNHLAHTPNIVFLDHFKLNIIGY